MWWVISGGPSSYPAAYVNILFWNGLGGAGRNIIYKIKLLDEGLECCQGIFLALEDMPEHWQGFVQLPSCSMTFREGALVGRHVTGKWFVCYGSVCINHVMKSLAWALRAAPRTVSPLL
jgi:hypothetical protein